MNVIQACWIISDSIDAYCEYCSNQGNKKIYLPMTKSTLNPAHICEDCVKNYKIIGWYDNEKNYLIALFRLKEQK